MVHNFRSVIWYEISFGMRRRRHFFSWYRFSSWFKVPFIPYFLFLFDEVRPKLGGRKAHENFQTPLKPAEYFRNKPTETRGPSPRVAAGAIFEPTPAATRGYLLLASSSGPNS